MKHLVIGDIHGYHSKLRGFLEEQKLIDVKGDPINRDKTKVYCVGDLIDGEINRSGDILNMEYAEAWFDKVCLGNHEYAFLGGKEFTSRRKYDRKTTRLILNLIDKEIYTPAILISDSVLVTHGGLSEIFDFDNARDAHEYIDVMWKLKPDLDDEVVIFDNSSTYNYGKPSAPGIFYLDWTDKRNQSFMQIVGHSTYFTGPVYRKYDNGIVHWNVDVGAKSGLCVGGIILDDVTGKVEVRFYGDRHENGFTKQKKTYPPQGDVMTFDPKAAKSASAPKQLPMTTSGGTPTTAGTKKDKKKDKKNKENKENKGVYQKLNIIPNETLSEMDIALIEDPHILEVYKREVKNGNDDLRIKDFVKEKAMH